jgi:4-hydroxyproline epimerase
MKIIDSHTGGQPTRVIVEGGPDLGDGPLSVRAKRFAENFDSFRAKAVLEPRGSEAMVGALLCQPHDPSCAAGAIFFNTTGYLGMCGHATIGLAVTLGHLGIWQPGAYRLETPVGLVDVELHDRNKVSFENVESYVYRQDVKLSIPGLMDCVGDIAWGGNWFYLVKTPECDVSAENIETLTDLAWRIRKALTAEGMTGAHGAEIDHIEFFGPATEPTMNSRNFVLCPGGAYDRSPCGTGTSAKLACLARQGTLKPGDVWVQESIVGSTFSASYRLGAEGRVVPTITGTAHIMAEGSLIFQESDPFVDGISL